MDRDAVGGNAAADRRLRRDSMLTRALILGLAAFSVAGCHHLDWPHGQVVPPVANAQPLAQQPACPPCPDPYAPGAPCYPEEYVVVEPGHAYVMPGAPPPTFAAPPGPVVQGAPQAEDVPGWFDVLPSGETAISPDFGLPTGPRVDNPLPNPLVVPIANSELAWDQLADVVSTYFPIAREQPVQMLDGVLTEGFVETPPQVSATVLEPHRKDSAGAFNRWQSTLQTVRRRAYVRVIPVAEGWAIDVQVFKELEDLPHPERASAGQAVLRNDNSLPSGRVVPVSLTRESDVWIRLGRDEPLEQKMLGEIQERLAGAAQTGHAAF